MTEKGVFGLFTISSKIIISIKSSLITKRNVGILKERRNG